MNRSSRIEWIVCSAYGVVGIDAKHRIDKIVYAGVSGVSQVGQILKQTLSEQGFPK